MSKIAAAVISARGVKESREDRGTDFLILFSMLRRGSDGDELCGMSLLVDMINLFRLPALGGLRFLYLLHTANLVFSE